MERPTGYLPLIWNFKGQITEKNYSVFHIYLCSVNQKAFSDTVEKTADKTIHPLQTQCLQGVFHLMAVEKLVDNVENLPFVHHRKTQKINNYVNQYSVTPPFLFVTDAGVPPVSISSQPSIIVSRVYLPGIVTAPFVGLGYDPALHTAIDTPIYNL